MAKRYSKFLGQFFPAFVALLATNYVHAHDLSFEEAYVREPPPVSHMTAGYVVIGNQTDSDIVLVGAYSERFGMVEFHESRTEDGVSRMRELDALRVPAGGVVTLRPGGTHLMLMRPVSRPTAGEIIVLTFEDRETNTYEVEFVVSNQ